MKLKNDFNDILDEDDNSEEVLNNAVENLVWFIVYDIIFNQKYYYAFLI